MRHDSGNKWPERVMFGEQKKSFIDQLDRGLKRELVGFHREQGNVLTIDTHERSIKVDYGILQLDDRSRVRAFEEKPQIQSRVSMGIYVMEPEVLEHIPPDPQFDLPNLVHALIAADLPVGGYRDDALWYDIGRVEDYEDAADVWLNREATNGNGHVPVLNGQNGKGNGQRIEGAGA